MIKMVIVTSYCSLKILPYSITKTPSAYPNITNNVNNLPAHINSPSVSPLIRVVGLNDMCLIDHHICINVSSVDPLAGEVLW